MTKKNKLATICAIILSVSTLYPIHAETVPYTLPDSLDENVFENILDLSAEDAVTYGLDHNLSIQILDNKIDLAIIASSNARTNVNDLKSAEHKLEKASDKLKSKKKELSAAQESLDEARTTLAKGLAPVPIPLTDSSGNPITDGDGNQIILPVGSNILNSLKALGLSDDEAYAMSLLISASITAELDSTQDTIDENSVALEEAAETIELNEDAFEAVLKDTSEKINTKINYNSIVSLDTDDAGKLIIRMAGVNLDITRYAKSIYKNQIAMLIQKNYYDALHAEKILALKTTAKERGEAQYNIVKLSYDNGMKAKDDFLLSKMYYDSTVITYQLAEATYQNALFELKKNIGLDMNASITLKDSMLTEVTEEDLDYGLKTGLTNRIEIQKNLGQLMIYTINEDILTSNDTYNRESKAKKEAILLREGSELELEKNKLLVSSQINQSYQTMVATGKMLAFTDGLITNAEDVVTIANLKYEQGFGAENALLKEMNLQESSGTIIELIAAQEKLADIEAQVAKIRYSYTMSKIKYYNDSGILTY